MQLVGRKLVEDYIAGHADLTQPARAWMAEVEASKWGNPPEMKLRYPTASIIAGDIVIFNLKGNRYRLEARVDYQRQVVVVRRIGTHAEYSRWTY